MTTDSKLSIWRDTVSDPEEQRFIVSRERGDTYDTLKIFAIDDFESAMEFLNLCAQREWLPSVRVDEHGNETPIGELVVCTVDEFGRPSGFSWTTIDDRESDVGRFGKHLRPGYRVLLADDRRGVVERVHSHIHTCGNASGGSNYVNVDIRVVGAP